MTSSLVTDGTVATEESKIKVLFYLLPKNKCVLTELLFPKMNLKVLKLECKFSLFKLRDAFSLVERLFPSHNIGLQSENSPKANIVLDRTSIITIKAVHSASELFFLS